MDKADIEDLFASLGPVTIKRLFSGKGIYHQGMIIAAEMRGDILLKADAETAPLFRSAGATQWVYTYPNGKTISMPYWTVPAEAFDDADQMAQWVHRAFAAACRTTK